MTYYDAAETVELQGINGPRIAANQQANPGAAGSGAYMTKQADTAAYYADLAGGQGRAGGPAVVRIDVPEKQWTNFVEKHGIQVETEIPRGPSVGSTETLIPMEHIDEFNEFADFSIHYP